MENKLFLDISAKISERGQSLVEMAISLIFILTLLAGAVDFGIALYSYVAIRDAAQEGALYASINGSDGTSLDCTAIEERVRTSSSNPIKFILDDGNPNPDITVNACTVPFGAGPDYGCPTSCSVSGGVPCEGYGAVIQVEVNYTYQLSMPILPQLLGMDEIPLTASVTDAILQPVCP